MKALIQRVSGAGVRVKDSYTGKIRRGILVFLCAVKGDAGEDLDYVFKKVSHLRIFDDAEGKMNLSVLDIKGEVLIISQFTLAASTRKGNRPSFDNAEPPAKAKEMYETFVGEFKKTGLTVETGVFGEYMEVSLTNDGPVTFLVDSRERKRD